MIKPCNVGIKIDTKNTKYTKYPVLVLSMKEPNKEIVRTYKLCTCILFRVEALNKFKGVCG